ncbi:methyltransferase family protein [Kibdelosporangium aridum]
MLFGFGLAQALYVVAELNISTALLDGPRSVEQLAAESNADSGALRRIIRYLTSYDVFRLRGDRVEVTDLGRTLADGVPGSVRGLPATGWRRTINPSATWCTPRAPARPPRHTTSANRCSTG